MFVLFFFFFQAEDGIRVATVTGVQTCALPISELRASARRLHGDVTPEELDPAGRDREIARDDVEERRLPRTVRPEDRPPLPWLDLEVDVADRVKAPEAPADPP